MQIYLVGIDEAGYGPLLGPLVLSASVWKINTDDAAPDKIPNLWKVLSKFVTKDTKDIHKIIIADSKELYKPRKILKLEETVLTTFLSIHPELAEKSFSIEDFIKATSFSQDVSEINKIPWYQNLQDKLPFEANIDKCKLRSVRLNNFSSEHKLKFEYITSRIITAAKFNQLIAKFNNKSLMHWDLTASIIKELASKFNPLRIVIDKQGGRDFYESLLKKSFPGYKVIIEYESKSDLMPASEEPSKTQKSEKSHIVSSYIMSNRETEIKIAFVSEAEKISLPVALASCYAKYTRELLIEKFNEYFRNLYPEIKETRGYYTDGVRFIKDLRTLGFEVDKFKHILIRNR